MNRIAAITALTASVLLLGSCMHGQAYVAGDMGWSLHETPEEGAKLAYGAPNSDNVALMMTCQPASGAVLVSTNAMQPAVAIVLKSGRTETALPATAMPSMGEGHFLEAGARANDPVLASFARTGDITLMQGKDSMTLAARAGDRPRISRFFAACKA
ncbi:hypothetical protein [Caulobacter sp. NIBR1757]|uniref:hypothetical protein n=1 Tax=Caulobacter sp. NIBR1757 TaxID=3016000 RepID=UPI0022F00CC6|nr:hypothetical protein [Caulobacter sp. NIBR1757]WGM38637.1 hypothetical protein AMEJIAPC_01541 [Caulobacter sp. NIBR1757]